MVRRTHVIGLTGSIGMGKSTVTRQLEQLGAKTCNADAIVHQLMSRGGKAVEAVAALFPGTLKDGAIDRQTLGKIVFGDKERMKALEAILHPLVVAEEEAFVHRHAANGAKLVVLDIPLLYETSAQDRFDEVIVVSAPAFLQWQRVSRRPGMSAEKYKKILASQIPDRQKRRLADMVVATGLGRGYSLRQLKAYLGTDE